MDRYRKLHLLFRRLQQKNRFVSRDLGTDLPILESFLMMEIDADSSRIARDLAELLEVNKSSISRSLAALTERGYLRAAAGGSDARSKLVQITGKGRRFLEKYDALSNQLVEGYFSGLSTAEQDEVAAYMDRLADRLGTSPGVLREVDFAVRVAMRRLTRSFGILKPNFMNSGLNTTQWQVLSEIEYNPAVVIAHDLVEPLSTPEATISSVVKSLQRSGLVQRTQSSHDLRQYVLSLSDRGRAVLFEIEAEASSRIKGALRGVSAKDQERFVDLLERFVGSVETGIELDAGWVVKALRSESSRSRARAFVIERVSADRRYSFVQERVIDFESYTFALSRDFELSGVIEFQLKGRDELTLAHFEVSKWVREDLVASFLDTAREAALVSAGTHKYSTPDRFS